LTEEELLKEALEIEFVTADGEQERRRSAYYARIVELSLTRDNDSEFAMPTNIADFVRIKEEAGAELASVAYSLSGDETFTERLRRVQRKYFKPKKP
jgi:hypothetical protein